MHRFYYIITLTLSLLWTGTYAQIVQPSPKQEFRAVWLTTLSGLDWPTSKAGNKFGVQRQKEELCNILDKLEAANFNAVVLQVRTRAAVIYPSQIEPWDVCLTGKYGVSPGYDPLAFAINECHKRGMQLHAWVVAIPGNKFAQSKALGKSALEKRVPDLCLKTNDAYMLNPGIPGTADYLASLCEEITKNYDVDGISLDYIRYPEKEVKFNDLQTYKKYSDGKQSLQEWRRANISRCVKAIHDKVKAIKPWVAISCSPVGKFRDTKRYSSGGWNAYYAVAQDAKLWLKKGWMDILMPMMYFKDNHFFPFALDWQEDSYGRCIATGLGVYLTDKNQKNWQRNIIESEIEFGRTHGLGGQVFFRSRFITDNTKGIYDNLKNNIYYTKALPPPLAGESIPTPAAPIEGNVTTTKKNTVLTWKGNADDYRYILYRSYQYPVNTESGACIYLTNISQTNITINTLYPMGLMPYYAVTAINRYGMESKPIELNKPYQFVDVSKFTELQE